MARQVKGSELEVSQQYFILVYPFGHALSGTERAERLELAGECWSSWWSRFSPSELEVAKDDSVFFLPYVRELLFPELCFEPDLTPADESTPKFTQSERLARLVPTDMANLPVDAVLRLSFDADHLKDLRSLQLELERKGRDGAVIDRFSARFSIEWVDVALFPQSVGFLAIKLRINEEGLTVGQIREFQSCVRIVHPPKVGWTLASWKGTGEGTSFKFNSRDLVDYLLQGFTGPSSPIETKLVRYLERLVQSDSQVRYTESALGQTYGQSFNMFTFCLLKDSARKGPQEGEGSLQAQAAACAASGTQEEHSLFESPSSQALYELATCTNSTAPDYVPHPEFLKQLWKQHHFAQWANWQAMTLHSNVVFLGMKETGFTQYALGHNVESDYFTLYLFALFQRTRLSVMFGELTMRDSKLHKNLKRARHLWNSFLAFQDHYWFSEVTRSRQGTELYHHYQEGLDVIALHRQLSAQVRELQAYYEGKFERRLGRLMNLLTFIGVPTTLIVTLFSKFFMPEQISVHQALLSSILVYACFLILWGMWTYYMPE